MRLKNKNNLRELYNWSLNGHSCWLDFLGIAHENHNSSYVDFSTYGYIELELFGKCLTIFSNNGYEEVTRLIDEVLKEIEQEEG
tara:strand:- start:341 stop:592 length:252 start_codon:yes stop_codon:yes gene_type:complete